MNRLVSAVDTGEESSFLQKDIPRRKWPLIELLREFVKIRDAGNRSVRVGGNLSLEAEHGNLVEAVSFYVVECISTQVLLGCDFFEK